MPRVILDDHECAGFNSNGRTFMVSGHQIRQRANKHRDPIELSPGTVIGITEDDKPFLEWKDD